MIRKLWSGPSRNLRINPATIRISDILISAIVLAYIPEKTGCPWTATLSYPLPLYIFSALNNAVTRLSNSFSPFAEAGISLKYSTGIYMIQLAANRLTAEDARISSVMLFPRNNLYHVQISAITPSSKAAYH